MTRREQNRIAPSEEALLTRYARVVDHGVQRYAPRLRPTCERPEDLETALRLALLTAIRAYDPARGAKFLTFAVFTVNHAAKEFCRNATGIRLKHHAREVPASQIPWPSQEDTDDSWDALLADQGLTAPSAEMEAFRAARMRAMKNAVCRLPPRERRVLRALGDGVPASVLARELGVCESRVWQIRMGAQQRLRAMLTEWE